MNTPIDREIINIVAAFSGTCPPECQKHINTYVALAKPTSQYPVGEHLMYREGVIVELLHSGPNGFHLIINQMTPQQLRDVADRMENDE